MPAIPILCAYRNLDSERSVAATKDFIVRQIGEMIIVYPAGDPWLPLKTAIGSFPEEYMLDREQPTWKHVEKREVL